MKIERRYYYKLRHFENTNFLAGNDHVLFLTNQAEDLFTFPGLSQSERVDLYYFRFRHVIYHESYGRK